MKQYNNISTLIFDLGGVIVDLDLAKCIQNFKELGLENIEQYLSNFGQKDFFMQFEKGQIGIPAFRNEIRKLAGTELSDAQIDKAWCSFLTQIPVEKLHLLSELKKKYRSIVYKRRLTLPYGRALDCLTGDCPWPETQIGREIGYAMDFYPDLEPRVFLSYERDSWYAPESGLRITFDDRLAGRYVQQLQSEVGDFVLRRADGSVIEGLYATGNTSAA